MVLSREHEWWDRHPVDIDLERYGDVHEYYGYDPPADPTVGVIWHQVFPPGSTQRHLCLSWMWTGLDWVTTETFFLELQANSTSTTVSYNIPSGLILHPYLSGALVYSFAAAVTTTTNQVPSADWHIQLVRKTTSGETVTLDHELGALSPQIQAGVRTYVPIVTPSSPVIVSWDENYVDSFIRVAKEGTGGNLTFEIDFAYKGIRGTNALTDNLPTAT